MVDLCCKDKKFDTLIMNDLYKKIKENKDYFEDIITRSVYHSNAIEGSTLSYAETYTIIFANNDININVNANAREIYDAINLKYAFNIIFESLGFDISIDLIKNIGIQLNKNINEIDDFRKVKVIIRGAEHIPPDAADVPRLTNELIYKWNHRDGKNIYEDIARFHIEFERIHPFSDGNGRTGRVLIAKQLLENNLPIIVIKKEDRTDYFEYLANQDVNSLTKLFEKLNYDERERMKKFSL